VAGDVGAAAQDRTGGTSVKVTITRPVIKRCPFKDETDAGVLKIVFDGEAPELHALAADIDRLCAEPVTHEAFTAAVAELVPEAMVTTTWSTGPWAAEVIEGAELWAKYTPAS
jgi:hypothetical protein